MNEQQTQVKNDSPLDIYVNSVHISASIYEIVLDFNLNTPTNDGFETAKLVKIRMSPQHAKALNALLSKHLEVYSEQFHEIYLPKDLLDRVLGIKKVGDTNDDNNSKSSE